MRYAWNWTPDSHFITSEFKSVAKGQWWRNHNGTDKVQSRALSNPVHIAQLPRRESRASPQHSVQSVRDAHSRGSRSGQRASEWSTAAHTKDHLTSSTDVIYVLKVRKNILVVVLLFSVGHNTLLAASLELLVTSWYGWLNAHKSSRCLYLFISALFALLLGCGLKVRFPVI